VALSPERLSDDVAALVLIAPAGFGRIHVAEAIQLPGVRTVVRHGLPLALMNPVTALGVYMAVVGNGQPPDPELVARLRKNAHRWARPARAPRRCDDRVPAGRGQRLEDDGPPSQRERPSELARFIEAACARARPSGRDTATVPQPRTTRVLAARFTPHPLSAGVGELPDIV